MQRAGQRGITKHMVANILKNGTKYTDKKTGAKILYDKKTGTTLVIKGNKVVTTYKQKKPKKYGERVINLISKNIKLQDSSYESSNTSLTLKLKRIENDEDSKIYYLDAVLEFENEKAETELAVFDFDIDFLKNLEYSFPVTDIYFTEPDISLTVIDYESDELCIYVNLDSGLKHKNESTDSGLSIRLNVEKQVFDNFINQIILLEQEQ
ncbi:TPA: hypothetical protein I1647_000897 [Staphylococcus pseudintermedius]|nr:hypothetical protein [Staphylococcus pseudintermedius]EJF1329750.1 hypothetical protein [Staphylococcus pseudintermedius]EKI4600771.1 hypothetical protein [Staphylococcus pseudintermedius]ELD8105862.1 hypothetical protein [Staphylococcus pseudintermedius]ELP8677025.1 hypothetical protein [Staphylococcus pseudintermedius]